MSEKVLFPKIKWRILQVIRQKATYDYDADDADSGADFVSSGFRNPTAQYGDVAGAASAGNISSECVVKLLTVFSISCCFKCAFGSKAPYYVDGFEEVRRIHPHLETLFS